MKITELQRNKRYWCWWMSRYLVYQGKIKNGGERMIYKFKDYGDKEITLTSDEAVRLICK